MIYVGIDVAKDKHDCIIVNSDDEVLVNSFTFPNNRIGFEILISNIFSCSKDLSQIKVGLEATGHYSNNLLEFLMKKALNTYVINPLHTNLYRKGLSLRKTKTDKVDAHSIVTMLRLENLKPYSHIPYHIQELKSLTRYRFSLIQDCARLKISYVRLCNIVFPELESLVSTLHVKAVYSLLLNFPSAEDIANCHLTKLSNLLSTSSKRHYSKAKSIEIRQAAKCSIGFKCPIKSLELQQTIHLIEVMQEQIDQIESQIIPIVDKINSPIMSIPGISYRMAAIILAEIGDFNRFSSAEKILAYAGMEPSVYQSGKLTSTHAKMVKRGSKYLRYALFNATKYVCRWDPSFGAFLQKKRSEGKPYNVAISHAAKKLVRTMTCLVKTDQPFKPSVN